MGWTIPKESIVNEAWVKDPTGARIIDFAAHPYHLWIHSQPFSGEVSRGTMLEHSVAGSDKHGIPLR